MTGKQFDMFILWGVMLQGGVCWADFWLGCKIFALLAVPVFLYWLLFSSSGGLLRSNK